MNICVWKSFRRDGCRICWELRKNVNVFEIDCIVFTCLRRIHRTKLIDYGPWVKYGFIIMHPIQKTSIRMGWARWKCSEAATNAIFGRKGNLVCVLGLQWNYISRLLRKRKHNNRGLLLHFIRPIEWESEQTTSTFVEEKNSVLSR